MGDDLETNSSNAGSETKGSITSGSEGGSVLKLVPRTREEIEASEGTTVDSDVRELEQRPVDSQVHNVDITPEKMAELEQERLFRQESEAEAAKRMFTEALVPIAGALVHTALFSPNARVKLEAQKMIIDRTLGRVQDAPPAPEKDAFAELLASCVRRAVEPTDVQSKDVTKDGELQ